MKILQIVCLMFVFQGSAYAAGYVETNNNLNLCKAQGNFAAAVYDLRGSGDTLRQTLTRLGGPGFSTIIYRVYESHYSNRTDAYMDTYAHCMDEHDY